MQLEVVSYLQLVPVIALSLTVANMLAEVRSIWLWMWQYVKVQTSDVKHSFFTMMNVLVSLLQVTVTMGVGVDNGRLKQS